jgi:hypothetical protein
VKLILERAWPLIARTVGRLYLNDLWESYTCEDRIRLGPKVYGETAIPYGTYKILATKSAKFGRVMPEIVGVPGYSGLRFHGGNTEHDTLGCVLVGYTHDAEGIYDCALAAKRLEGKILAALASGDDVTIDVVNPYHELVQPDAVPVP